MKIFQAIWEWFHKYSKEFTESLVQENKELQEKYAKLKQDIEDVRKELSKAQLELENMYEKAKYNVYKPEIKKTVKKIIIENSLRICLKVPQNKIILTDDIYYLTSLEEMEKLIKSDPTNKKKYQKDIWDCDSFSAELYGVIHLFGGFIMDCSVNNSKMRHSVNGFIDKNLNVYIIEGETDKITLAQEYKIIGQKINFNNEKDMVRV